MGKRIFVISGEESGDLHGASLISALKRLIPSLEVNGMGGERMRQAGLKGLDSKELSVVGIVEVVEKLSGILRAFKEIKSDIGNKGADAVVLIDFPDFNLRVARAARRLGVPVIYYISPQVWAWRKGRIKTIAGLVDKMLVVFPFEVRLYQDAGVDVEYVGHPLVDTAVSPLSAGEARFALGLHKDSTVVSLLPGSRTGEVGRLLKPMLVAGGLIEKGLNRRLEFVIPIAGSIEAAKVEEEVKKTALSVKLVKGVMHAALRASDAAIVASGTATLETALIGTPMVIVYRMSPMSYAVARMLVGVDNVGLPNIVAGRRIVPELIQQDASPEAMAREVVSILTDRAKRDAMMEGYREIRKSLGKGGAAERAARIIRDVITR